ncbi:hypothetical protein D3C84_716440 [compost metagenome]
MVADTMQLAAGGALDQGHELGQRRAMVGIGDHQAVLVAAALPAQLGIAAAQAFGHAVQGELAVGFVDQGEAQGGLAGVDHQDIACGHQLSSEGSGARPWAHQPQGKKWPSWASRRSGSSTQARDCQGGWCRKC